MAQNALNDRGKADENRWIAEQEAKAAEEKRKREAVDTAKSED